MPTGYTQPVKDGVIIDFADFALKCARGFMPFVLLRDSDQSLEATRRFIKGNSYLENLDSHEKWLEDARTKLAKLESMTTEEALRAAEAEATKINEHNRDMESEVAEVRARYEAMLAKVDAWEPPTPDHKQFKEFMREQLANSIEYDCNLFYMNPPDVSLAWRDEQIERTRQEIARLEKQLEDAHSRNEERKQWIAALIESLGER